MGGTCRTRKTSSEMYGRMETLLDVLDGLGRWSDDFLARGAKTVAESEAYTSGQGTLDFPDFDVASAWVFWLGFKIHALECYISVLDIVQHSERVSEASESDDSPNDKRDGQPDTFERGRRQARSEILETVQLVIRSVPYFLEAKVGLIGRSFVAFPLETARVALLHEYERETNHPISTPLPHIDKPETAANMKTQTILQALGSCEDVASRAKSIGCALFSDEEQQVGRTRSPLCNKDLRGYSRARR